MLNRCEFIGNLGADPECRRLSSGDPVVNFRIAVSEVWRDKSSGERKEKTEWVPVVIFNKGLASIAEKYLRKGSKVFVVGSWQTRRWKDQQGNDRYSTEVVLSAYNGQIILLDGKGAGDRQEPRQEPQEGRELPSSNGGGRTFDDDQIPF